MKHRRKSLRIFLFGGASLLILLFLTAVTHQTLAAALVAPALPVAQDPTPAGPEGAEPGGGSEVEGDAPEQLDIPNEVCLGCHGQPGPTLTLENGEAIGLYVPAEVYHTSVHGQMELACVQCHRRVGNYPHPPFTAADSRDKTLKLNGLCQECHADKFELTQDSVHEAALEAGNREAAVCTDCHTAHAVQRLQDAETGERLPETRTWSAQTCARCHYAIFQIYSTSVHGEALLTEGNPDVPTCIDCHGVHSIEDPNTARFRLRSPQMCGECHANPAIMNKYGISTQVLETYVADFHGTTVTLFEQQHPDQEVNEAVCYDCHGIHDILSVSDPQKGLQVRQNMLMRCQECHPNAGENFPAAWLSHYIPSPTRHPLVYMVNLFYTFFIPAVLGGMAILVAMDVASKLQKRRPKPYPPSATPVTGTVGVFPADISTAIADQELKEGVTAGGEAPPGGELPPVDEAATGEALTGSETPAAGETATEMSAVEPPIMGEQESPIPPAPDADVTVPTSEDAGEPPSITDEETPPAADDEDEAGDGQEA